MRIRSPFDFEIPSPFQVLKVPVMVVLGLAAMPVVLVALAGAIYFKATLGAVELAAHGLSLLGRRIMRAQIVRSVLR
jgi:hypothetical protein